MAKNLIKHEPTKQEYPVADGFGLVLSDYSLEFARHGMKTGDYLHAAAEYLGAIAELERNGSFERLEMARMDAWKASNKLESAAAKLLGNGGKHETVSEMLSFAAELAGDGDSERKRVLIDIVNSLTPALRKSED